MARTWVHRSGRGGGYWKETPDVKAKLTPAQALQQAKNSPDPESAFKDLYGRAPTDNEFKQMKGRGRTNNEKRKAKEASMTPKERIRAAYDKENQKTIKDLGDDGRIDPVTVQGTPLDTSGVDALKSQALTPSQESAWLKMASEKQGLEEAQMLDQAQRGAAQQAATAQSNLAMQGGLRSGALERLSGASGDQALLAQQGVRGQGALTRAGLGVQAEQNRLGALGQLPGAQLQAAQYGTGIEQYNATTQNLAEGQNVKNRVDELARRQGQAKDIYGMDMGDWAANQQANALAAQKNPGLLGGGGILGTGIGGGK